MAPSTRTCHALLNNVYNFDGGPYRYRDDVGLAENATLVGQWYEDGLPLEATMITAAGQRSWV